MGAAYSPVADRGQDVFSHAAAASRFFVTYALTRPVALPPHSGPGFMRLLLGSGGFRTEERVQLLVSEMRAFFGSVKRLLFIPYALQDHDGYVQMLIKRGLDAGYELDPIHKHTEPTDAVRRAEAIYIGGGNTFRLLQELYRFGLVGLIRTQVLAGMPYLGISAGTNVACPTIKTTNDMPITWPPVLNSLNMVPFQVNAHYFTGQTFVKHGETMQEHFGETRDERLREFHEMNDTPVIGLWEGGILHVDDAGVRLVGSPARIFRKGQTPVDVEPGMITV
jgi:dipeptidase E